MLDIKEIAGFDVVGICVFLTAVSGVFALSFGRVDQWGHRRMAFGFAICFATLAVTLLSRSLLWLGGLLWGGQQLHVGWGYINRRYRTNRDHAEYLQASASALAYIALADGDITERESSLIRETYARAGFSGTDIAELTKIVRECQRRFRGDGSDYQRVFAWLKDACETVVKHSNPHTRRLFFRTAVLLAATDGFISTAEDRALKASGSWLGLTEEDVNAIWRSIFEAKSDEATSSGTGPSESADSEQTQKPSVPPDLAAYYASMLGVTVSASPADLKKAYHAKAKQYHPDVVAHRGPIFAQEAEERFKEFSRAYDFLRGRTA